jgi:hypothetical protein
MKKHHFRPSAERKVPDARWTRNHRGQWRHETEEVSEVEFCHRATRERSGFHKGARLRAY